MVGGAGSKKQIQSKVDGDVVLNRYYCINRNTVLLGIAVVEIYLGDNQKASTRLTASMVLKLGRKMEI